MIHGFTYHAISDPRRMIPAKYYWYWVLCGSCMYTGSAAAAKRLPLIAGTRRACLSVALSVVFVEGVLKDLARLILSRICRPTLLLHLLQLHAHNLVRALWMLVLVGVVCNTGRPSIPYIDIKVFTSPLRRPRKHMVSYLRPYISVPCP